MPLTPFDVSKYRKAQPVITRDGRSITNLKEQYYSEIAETFLTAIVSGKPVIWDITGKKDYTNGTPDELDLFMGEIITYYWAETDALLVTDPNNIEKYSQVFIVEPL